jgi:hypothetical protein
MTKNPDARKSSTGQAENGLIGAILLVFSWSVPGAITQRSGYAMASNTTVLDGHWSFGAAVLGCMFSINVSLNMNHG